MGRWRHCVKVQEQRIIMTCYFPPRRMSLIHFWWCCVPRGGKLIDISAAHYRCANSVPYEKNNNKKPSADIVFTTAMCFIRKTPHHLDQEQQVTIDSLSYHPQPIVLSSIYHNKCCYYISASCRNIALVIKRVEIFAVDWCAQCQIWNKCWPKNGDDGIFHFFADV